MSAALQVDEMRRTAGAGMGRVVSGQMEGEMERAQWSYQGKDESGWDEGEITVTITPTGAHFSIEEEQAVDSYNEMFTCSCDVPLDKLSELAAMLNAALARIETRSAKT